jgi:hypothetical protein
MKVLSIFLTCLLFTDLLRGQEPPLRVAVVVGEGARNKINQKESVEPVVQVQDANGKPIEGASVVFSLPARGPGGTFDNGGKTLTVTTDPQGRATARSIQVNRLKGSFNIQVVASYQGRSGNAVIAQKSVTRTARSSGVLGVSTKAWVILGISLIAIAGGIFAAKELRSRSNGNVITATPGIPVVVGGPQ